VIFRFTSAVSFARMIPVEVTSPPEARADLAAAAAKVAALYSNVRLGFG